jgi:hypothetical protein
MRRLLITAASVAIVASNAASGTTLIVRRFPDLVRGADGIVAGTVVDTIARRGEGGSIHTYVTLGELEIIRGEYIERTLTLRQEGGTVDGERLRIAGAPTFRQGERVVVMIAGNGERPVPIAGWEEGLFRVIRDQATGREVVTDALGNRVFGMRDGQLLKERRVNSEVQFQGGDRQQPDRSAMASGSFGRADTGAEGSPLAGQGSIRLGEVTAGEPIDYASFVRQLRELVRQTRAADPLISVDPTVPVPPGVRRDGVVRPAQAAPSPRIEPMPGDLPRRLEMPPTGQDR